MPSQEPVASAAERCLDCGVVLTADNVWEPGTCKDCIRRRAAAVRATPGVAVIEDTSCHICGGDHG